MSNLNLGSKAGTMTVNLTRGDRSDLALRSLADDKVTPKPWAGVPVIVFDEGSEWTAVLSESNSLATWSESPAAVARIADATDRGVRLKVNGVTKWRGVVKIYD